MGFLPMPSDEELEPDARIAANRQIDLHGGRITNMKRTLLGHVHVHHAEGHADLLEQLAAAWRLGGEV